MEGFGNRRFSKQARHSFVDCHPEGETPAPGAYRRQSDFGYYETMN
jgi:hypothetical protein